MKSKFIITKPRSPVSYTLQDSSLGKASRIKSKSQRLYRSIPQKSVELSEQMDRVDHIHHLRKLTDQIQSVIKREVKIHKEIKDIQKEKATKIQSHFRGFLTRRHISPSIFNSRKEELKRKLLGISEIVDRCSFRLGTLLSDSASKIQRKFRTFSLKKKIERLRTAYDYYTHQKKENLKNFLKTALRVFICKNKVIVLSQEAYRNRSLRSIRRKLALLTIKKKWNLLGLTYNALMYKLRKGRIKHSKTEELAHLDMPEKESSSSVDTISSIDSVLKVEMAPPEFKKYKKHRLLAKEKRLKKIKLGKLSYGISQFKQVDICPVLADESDNHSKLLQINGHVLKSHVSKKQVLSRNTMINSGISHPSKGNSSISPLIHLEPADKVITKQNKSFCYVNEDACFLKNTISFSRHISDPKNSRKPRKLNRFKIRSFMRNNAPSGVKLDKIQSRLSTTSVPWKSSSSNQNLSRKNYFKSFDQSFDSSAKVNCSSSSSKVRRHRISQS